MLRPLHESHIVCNRRSFRPFTGGAVAWLAATALLGCSATEQDTPTSDTRDPGTSVSVASTPSPSNLPGADETPIVPNGKTITPTESPSAGQENSSGLDNKIKQATVGFVISCSGGGEPDVDILNYQTPDPGKFPMAISVTCGTPESAKARIITGEEQILPGDDQLLLLFDGSQGASGVSESELSEHARSSDGTTVGFRVDGFSVYAQASSCLAVGLSKDINNGGPVISSILIDGSNKATGTVGITCDIYQPGQQIQ